MYRAGHAPLPPGVFVAPFPRAIGPGTHDDRIDMCLAELRHLLVAQTAPGETAAMILEPVLGEGGYEPAPQRVPRLGEDQDAEGSGQEQA